MAGIRLWIIRIYYTLLFHERCVHPRDGRGISYICAYICPAY